MSWVIFTILATILQSFRNLEQKSLNKRLDALTVSWSRFIIPLPFAIIVVILTFYQFDKNMIVDTCTNIKNGKIEFNGKKKLYKGIYSLVGQGKSIYFDFIVDDDNQNLDISSESVSNYKELLQCSNSKIQNDFFNYIKYFENSQKQYIYIYIYIYPFITFLH